MMRAKCFGLVCVLALALAAPGCAKNPYDAATWTEKLDGREWEDAVTKLDQLGDPKAIPALVKAWERQGKPSKILQVIINLARPLTKEQYLKVYYQDNQTRDAHWDDAFPALTFAALGYESAHHGQGQWNGVAILSKVAYWSLR